MSTVTDYPGRKLSTRTAKDLTIGLGLLVLSVVARYKPLWPSSLWFDDAWVAAAYRLPWSDIPTVGLTAPGFVGLLKVAGVLFGNSSITFLAIPLFFGVTLAPMLWFVLKAHTGTWIAAAVSLLVVWAPVHMTHSSRVKQYTFDSFASLVLIVVGWRLLEGLNDWRRWRDFVVASAIAMFTSGISLVTIFAVCAVTGLGFVLDKDRRENAKLAVPSFAAIGLLTLVFWLTVLRHSVDNPMLNKYWAQRYLAPENGLGQYLSDLGAALHRTLEFMFSVRPLSLLWAVIIVATVVLIARRPLLAMLFLGPVVVTAVLATLERAPLGGGRTDSHLLTGIILLIGMGLSELRSLFPSVERRTSDAFAAAFAALALLWTVEHRVDPTPYPQEDLRPLVEDLADRRLAGEKVLVYYASPWAYAIYADEGVSIDEDGSLLSISLYPLTIHDADHIVMGSRRGVPEEYAIWVDEATRDRQPVWFVASHFRDDDIEAIAGHLLNSDYERVEVSSSRQAMVEFWLPRES